MLHHTCHKAPVYGSFVVYTFLFFISKLSNQQINTLVLGLSAVYPCSATVPAFGSSATAMLPVQTRLQLLLSIGQQIAHPRQYKRLRYKIRFLGIL